MWEFCAAHGILHPSDLMTSERYTRRQISEMLEVFAHRRWGPHQEMRMMANLNWSLHFLFGMVFSAFSKNAAYRGVPADFLPWPKPVRSNVEKGDMFFGIPDEEDE